MSIRLHHLVLPTALLALSATALAEPPRQTPDEPTRYSFEDDQVLADTVGPSGEILTIRKRGTRESLIRARDSFVVELLQSVEAL